MNPLPGPLAKPTRHDERAAAARRKAVALIGPALGNGVANAILAAYFDPSTNAPKTD